MLPDLLICPVCKREFDPGDRVSIDANQASIDRTVYCSETCARKAENKRYYEAHRQEIKNRVLSNQRGTRNKTLLRQGEDEEMI